MCEEVSVITEELSQEATDPMSRNHLQKSFPDLYNYVGHTFTLIAHVPARSL